MTHNGLPPPEFIGSPYSDKVLCRMAGSSNSIKVLYFSFNSDGWYDSTTGNGVPRLWITEWWPLPDNGTGVQVSSTDSDTTSDI